MAEKRYKVSLDRQIKAYEKTGGICVICGNKMSPNNLYWTVEHFIPRAIYRWIVDENLRYLIESERNIFIVHHNCNEKKDSAVPNKKTINNLHAKKAVKDELHEIYNEILHNLEAYRGIKLGALSRQNNKCAICARYIDFKFSTLRRIDNKKDRIADNAMCICKKCNLKATNDKRKERMVKNSKII